MRTRNIVAIAILTLSLAGCATCERHPAVCAAGVAIVATSVALSLGHSDSHHGLANTQPITCGLECAK